MSDREPVDPEMFGRTAPRWNCIDYRDGAHYVPGDACLWCGKSREDIEAGPLTHRVFTDDMGLLDE